MSVLYSFEIIFKSDQAEEFLQGFRQLLTKDCLKKLPSKKPWWKLEDFVTQHGKTIKRGLKGVKDTQNSYCFSITFPQDESFDEQAREKGFSRKDGIRCIDASLTIGTRWGILELTSTGRWISRLFSNPLLQEHIVDKLQGVSEVILLDMAIDGSMLLHPFKLPWKAFRYNDEYLIETFDAEGDWEFHYEFDVELYLEKVIQEVQGLKNK